MLQQYLHRTTKAAPLAVFRFLFGILMLVSIIRFWFKGWIETIYIQPKWYFPYYGFEFIKPLGNWTYVLFFLCAISALAVALGWFYRIAITTFFICFTYIELIDKTPYLNHYYFVIILSFLLIFLPANATFSIDAFKNPKKAFYKIPVWTIDSVKLLIGIVYVYAGLAKLNSDWLIDALPLKMWLINKTDIFIIGNLFKVKWMPYFFSWAGALYDLSIPFLLLYKPTRKLAFLAVVCFHTLTYILFPIGMFPFIMTLGVLIFFSGKFHQKIVDKVNGILQISPMSTNTSLIYKNKPKHKILKVIIALFFIIQLLLPWRYLLYPGELFWTEEGYRFSWRVMLIEKVGNAVFTIVNPKDGSRFNIQNKDFLTRFQIKQMSTQPDFILQYAHKLRDHYIKEGIKNPEVYVESYVTLNRRLSEQFIDPKVNLSNEKESFKHKKWITPFKGSIKGL